MGLGCSRWTLLIWLSFIVFFGVCWVLYALSVTHGKSSTVHNIQTTSSLSQHTLTQQKNISLILADRKATLMKMCKKNQTYSLPNRHHMIYNYYKHLLYCKATKAGSTFWGRLFLQIDRHRVASPYDIKPQVGVTNVKPSINEWKRFGSILKKTNKFIFSRHPLERLYSGYVDKVFSPNTFYWDSLGQYIAKKFRNTSKPNSECGHDVTFPEFLQYAIHSETTNTFTDVHVTSLWKSCSPCRVHYDVIGKMETFKDDTEYILDQFNLKPYKNVLRNISVAAVDDALYDTAQAYANMRSKAADCISKHQTAERIWTKLKARGFIAVDIPVPLNMYYKSETILYGMLKDTYSKSVVKLGRSGLKRQQTEIYLETLKRIPPTVLRQVEKAYEMDFKMFGYNNQFEESRNMPKNSNVYSTVASFFVN